MNVDLSQTTFFFFHVTIKRALKISARRFKRIKVLKTFIVVCFLADVIQNFLPMALQDGFISNSFNKKKKSVFFVTAKNTRRGCVRPPVVHVNQPYEKTDRIFEGKSLTL